MLDQGIQLLCIRNESLPGQGVHNKTVWVMTQGLIQTLLIRLPFAYIMSIQPNASLTMIGLAAPVSTMVGIILNVGFFLYLEKKERK